MQSGPRDLHFRDIQLNQIDREMPQNHIDHSENSVDNRIDVLTVTNNITVVTGHQVHYPFMVKSMIQQPGLKESTAGCGYLYENH